MPPEPKVPTFDGLMWPALVAMKALGGSATHEELLEKVIELERPSMRWRVFATIEVAA